MKVDLTSTEVTATHVTIYLPEQRVRFDSDDPEDISRWLNEPEP